MSRGADRALREGEKMNITVNDVRLGIEDRGADRALREESAPTLVMLHGFTCALSPLTCLATDNPLLPLTRSATPLSTAGKTSWQRYKSLA